jgi:phosphomannomutase / phosphoglucomutase
MSPPPVSTYRAPAWLPGGHLQTIYSSLFIRVAPVEYRREQLELADGDFLDFDWIDSPSGAPVVVLFHGLEGSADSPYARDLMATVQARGWHGVVAHFRGCSGEDNRLPRAYFAGDSEDIERILRHVKSQHADAPVYAVGVSLGGNALLKWLGEQGEAAYALVERAAGISAPLDLTAAGRTLDRGFNRRVYTARFLVTLKAKALRKAARFPGVLDADAIAAATTFREFDTLVTARLHGFRDAEDYWLKVSSKPLLKSIAVPTLIINARNDPFLPAWALPSRDEVSPAVTLEQPDTGGHVAFPSGPFPGNLDWLPKRLMQHFDTRARIDASPIRECVVEYPKEIFKAYDIRGIVGKTFTPEIVEAIGHAIGSEAVARGQTDICIGRDGRLSGPDMAAALARGIRKAGIGVVDLGMVATPMTYFAAYQLNTNSAVMVTGSHNPPDYNGLKMVLGGETLSGDAIQALRERLLNNDLVNGEGGYREYDVAGEYLTRIVSDVKLARPMKIIIDCGNGVPGAFAPKLYRDMGCQVEELFCEVDGNFPNHHPDPSQPANLQDLIAALKTSDAEIGLAFDGDGDRLGVVTKDGSIIFPDRQLMLFADDVLSRNPGAEIIFDVKSTRNLFSWIRERGGRPLLWKTGHSFIKAKMKETGALLAGEMSGHVFFKERWFGFDDGLYAGARLLEYLSKQADINATLHGLPDSVNTPELNIKMAEGAHYALMNTLQKTARFPDAQEVITLDGLRVEYADGFGLARPSNTTPVIVLRFEADNAEALERIQADFRRVIREAAPDLDLPF